MKAEHRKELETNVLADRMGRLVQRMKERPKRRTTLYLVLGLVLFIGVFVFYRMRTGAVRERSERWVMLEDGFVQYIEALRKQDPDTNPGKAARLQYAWLANWDLGLKLLGVEPSFALSNMEKAEVMYLKLAEECAEDPVWEPEALYSLAIIQETKAVRAKDRSQHLDDALKRYKDLASKYKNSAHGKDAAKRAELLEKNRPQIVSFYRDLQDRLNIPEDDPEDPKTKRKKQ
ncbi:MAG: hypothetical protein FJ271_26625 [Planctomycetes bacterium]|nr:hypothetical protein [Planctomycetota bacterium]